MSLPKPPKRIPPRKLTRNLERLAIDEADSYDDTMLEWLGAATIDDLSVVIGGKMVGTIGQLRRRQRRFWRRWV